MLSIFEFELCGREGLDNSSLCDETLMERIAQRQEHALGELYTRYGGSLRGLIRSVVHEESEADDVLQESFLQIWQEAHNYSPKLGRPLGWVATIARRRAIDRVRRRDCYRRAKQRFQDHVRPGATPRSRNAMDSELAIADLRRFLDRHLQILPNSQRTAVELAYFGGLSQRQISARTGIPLGTIKTRLQLGLRKLAQCLRPLQQKI